MKGTAVARFGDILCGNQKQQDKPRYFTLAAVPCSPTNQSSGWPVQSVAGTALANCVTDEWVHVSDRRSLTWCQIAASLASALLVLLGFAASARAEDGIVDAAMGDINGDGREDLAILTLPAGKSSNDVGIAVYLRDPALPVLKRTLLLPARFWGTSSAGQQPEIAILENQSITVHTENMAFGREHWERTYTLAWRNAQLLVAGFTYTFNDTLDHDQVGSCDLNLLTGRGIRNGLQFTTGSQRINLVDWDDSIGLAACGMEEG